MRALLDSGILLRLVNRLDPEHATIRDALRLLKNRGDSLVMAPTKRSGVLERLHTPANRAWRLRPSHRRNIAAASIA